MNIQLIQKIMASVGVLVSVALAFMYSPVWFLVVVLAAHFCIQWRHASNAEEKIQLYEQIIDAVPLPLSVTDMDMAWTFVNKAATTPLGVSREDILGKHCSNWGANICGTENCGINCLRNNNSVTFFNQWGKDFKVDTSYLYGLKGTRIGHIEVVQEITEKVALQNVYYDIESLCQKLVNGADDLKDASHNLTVNSSQQAEALTQISVSTDGVSQEAQKNATNVHQTLQKAKVSEQAVADTVEQMTKLKDIVSEINASSESISNIINMIEDIASQTNLLALNASIEAARAGESGRGFAVVADEVRQLAKRSTQAASESTEFIQRSVSAVAEASKIADLNSELMEKVLSDVNSITRELNVFDVSSQEQVEYLTQINKSVSEIEQSIHTSAASAEETSATSIELNNLVISLNEQLSFIKELDGLFDKTSNKKEEQINIVNVS